MGFVRFIATKEIEAFLAFVDRLFEAEDRRQSPGLFRESLRIDTTLIGVRGEAIGDVILGRGRRTVEREPRETQLTAFQQSSGHLAMKVME